MYITFEQAMRLIKPNYKNKNYPLVRIQQLICNNELEEVSIDNVYIKSGDDFVSIGKIKTERLVTEESVRQYIEKRKKIITEHGKIPKKNRVIKALFADGTTSKFDSIEKACKILNISRYKINQSLTKGKYIEIPICKERASILKDIISTQEVKTERVRFY